MRFEGKLFLDENFKKSIVVDAEPHVMQRIRKIFDNARGYYNQGKYTHKPLAFPITLSGCRDLVWLMERYRFECEEALQKLINQKSNEYLEVLKTVEEADNDNVYKSSNLSFKLAIPLRDHQIRFNNMFKKVKKMLLADPLGLGKTYSALSTLCEPESRPAIVITPSHLCTQWEREIKKLIPEATTHIIRGFKNYPLPNVDILITSYNRLAPWQDILLSGDVQFNSVIFDEVHELRHTNTQKREIAQELAKRAIQSLGLSGTPIFNMGNEIWSVLDAIKIDCLGTYDDFDSEWCNWGSVLEPATLNSYLKKQGLMLRRTPEEAGFTPQIPSKNVVTIDSDLKQLESFQNVAKMLALSVLSGNVGEDAESARDFNFKLRQATGIAKAKPAAEFVKMLLESEQKVVLTGYHHAVYDIWKKEFKDIKTVWYTGDETIKEKDQSVKEFIEGDARIFIISIRSGSGLDGLQKVCNTMVIGELDWSHNQISQVIGRLARDGQNRHVQAYYLTVADGSDPFMMERLGAKRSQHDGLIEGKESEAELLKDSSAGFDVIREMAKSYLNSIGEEIPEVVEEVGVLGSGTKLLRQLRIPNNTEDEMQEAVHNALKKHLDPCITIHREYPISKRSRLDFLLEKGPERIAIECKINATKRTEVYRQVRRYVEEGKITALILLAPWHGISSFKVDGVPVIVLDMSVNQL